MKVADLAKQNQPAARSNARPVPLDVQESLKILRFRFRRRVGFRPVMGRGARLYRVDGEFRAESEILLWAGSGRSWSS